MQIVGNTTSRPLEHVTVVSLEHAIAAPFATRQLADLGARVIKIERPGSGDFARDYDDRANGLSSHFVWCNRSKESLAIDLKSELGATALRRLIEKSDVFVQNLAPGATDRMGLDFKTLHRLNSRLIVCDISGYGQSGSQAERKAYDLLIQAESGFLSVTGTADNMVKAGCSIADIAAGMYAYSNILAALIARQKTGLGSHIDLSMLEAMTEWMSFPLYYAYEGAPQPPRVGADHATIYPYGPFPTSSGDVLLGVQNQREWLSFCEAVIGNPSLANDPLFATPALRSANRDQLFVIIAAAFSGLSREEVLAKLQAAHIASGSVNSMAEVWTHPQLEARHRWTHVQTPAGQLPALQPPGQTDARMDPVPNVGEHTESILDELGLLISAR